MKRIVRFLVFVVSVGYGNHIFSQEINQNDEKGKKEGLWEIKVDSGFVVSENGYFISKTIYCHGKVFYAPECIKIEENVKVLKYGSNIQEEEKVYLDGEYEFDLNNKSLKKYYLLFDKGLCLKWRKDWDDSGSYFHEVDYTIKYNNNPLSYYYKIQTGDSKFTHGYYYIEEGKIKKEKLSMSEKILID